VVSSPLKNMKVSWDDYSKYVEKNVPNHQPVFKNPLISIHHPFGSFQSHGESWGYPPSYHPVMDDHELVLFYNHY